MDNQETIFARIIRREIPAQIVFESDKVLAFRDVNPQAPQHILIIPKVFMRNLSAATSADKELLGELLFASAEIARQLGVDQSGYRIVINNEAAAGQTVFHLHLHLLAGRELNWPPG